MLDHAHFQNGAIQKNWVPAVRLKHERCLNTENTLKKITFDSKILVNQQY